MIGHTLELRNKPKQIKHMAEMNQTIEEYEAPTLSVLYVSVERGFAASPTTEASNLSQGGDGNDIYGNDEY
jgi:hypothetical protein